MREILVTTLILALILGNLIGVYKIKKLQRELQEERNPSFAQAKDRFHSEFYGQNFYIEYWPTREQAIKNSNKVSANGNVEIVTKSRAEDSFLVMLWDAKQPGIGLEVKTSLLASGVVCLNAYLKPGTVYIIVIDYRGKYLYAAFELEKK